MVGVKLVNRIIHTKKKHMFEIKTLENQLNAN